MMLGKDLVIDKELFSIYPTPENKVVNIICPSCGKGNNIELETYQTAPRLNCTHCGAPIITPTQLINKYKEQITKESDPISKEKPLSASKSQN